MVFIRHQTGEKKKHSKHRRLMKKRDSMVQVKRIELMSTTPYLIFLYIY